MYCSIVFSEGCHRIASIYIAMVIVLNILWFKPHFSLIQLHHHKKHPCHVLGIHNFVHIKVCGLKKQASVFLVYVS